MIDLLDNQTGNAEYPFASQMLEFIIDTEELLHDVQDRTQLFLSSLMNTFQNELCDVLRMIFVLVTQMRQELSILNYVKIKLNDILMECFSGFVLFEQCSLALVR